MTRWRFWGDVVLGVGTVLTASVILTTLALRTTDAQSISPGVIVRSDGVVLIDPWVYYQASTRPIQPPNVPHDTINAPTKVIFGEGIADSVLVCREGPKGSRCVPLGQLLPRVP